MRGFLDYIVLTSPGITLLVMLTSFTGVWIASRGMAEPSLFLWSLAGIGLASAGASVFNNSYDRDIDGLMKRTSRRPLPAGRANPSSALLLGIILSITAFFVLSHFVNTLSAILSVLAIFIYSFLYTVVLKRKTPFATEIGGISGALPPVIGWTAVRGNIDFEAIVFFTIIFLWQPPHFWSLASRHIEDYKIAGIPVLPIVKDRKHVLLRSLIYVCALVLASVIPYFIGMADRFYLMTVLILGSIYIFLYLMAMLTKLSLDKHLFRYSIIYLSLTFLSLIINRI